MSGVFHAGFLALVMTVSACGSSETAQPPVIKKEKDSGGSGLKVDEAGAKPKDKNPTAAQIRSNRKETLGEEIQLLEDERDTAINRLNTLRGKKYSTLGLGLPTMSDKTVQGALASAGTSFLFGGLGLALGGIGGGSGGTAIDQGTGTAAARSAGVGGTGKADGSTLGGIDSSGMEGFTKGFQSIGDAVSVGITKSENEKTIKRITGTVEEMMQQWEVEIANLEAQIAAKNEEYVSLINMGV
ncbi:MAG: hypothetical protein FJ146_11795 [Deltaproteobacteria bacterium]|nr:hypothetical protein [Deltaproteobacteria bacterium]